jgi:hypothetical protein
MHRCALPVRNALGVAAALIAIAVPAVTALGASAAEHTSTNRYPPPTIGPLPPQPEPAKGDVSAQSVINGIWELGEVAYWRDDRFRGLIYDSGLNYISNFGVFHFINSNVNLNDQASSIANGMSLNVWVWEHANHQGGSIRMLPYGQCNSTTCYSYSNLGWANDKLSSSG